MSDDKTPTDVVRLEQAAAKPLRKPYSAPKLTRLGSLAELTRGGDQEQRGEGPGFSL
jgi:hypothetical protein